MAKEMPRTATITCSAMMSMPRSTAIPLAQSRPIKPSAIPSQGVNARATGDGGAGASLLESVGVFSTDSKYLFPYRIWRHLDEKRVLGLSTFSLVKSSATLVSQQPKLFCFLTKILLRGKRRHLRRVCRQTTYSQSGKDLLVLRHPGFLDLV